MLTRDCKEILKNLNSQCDDFGIINSIEDFYNNLPKRFNDSNIVPIFFHLQKLDYLEFQLLLDGKICFIKLTHKGTHYREISLIELKNFLLKSILTPTVVALITTLIKDYLVNK